MKLCKYIDTNITEASAPFVLSLFIYGN